MAILTAYEVECHEGIHSRAHTDGIVLGIGTLHICGGIHHLYILAHHIELPQLTGILLVLGTPPAPAVQAAEEGDVVV